MRRFVIATATTLAAGGIALGVAGTSSARPADRITICHGTASETNPYVEITVSANSFKDGHFEDGIAPGHGPNNHPDFILEEGRTCDDGPTGSTTTTTELPPPPPPEETTTTIHL